MFQPVEFASWLDKVYKRGDFDLSIVDHAEARDIGNYANPGTTGTTTARWCRTCTGGRPQRSPRGERRHC